MIFKSLGYNECISQKVQESAEGAIAQIMDKEYCRSLEDYQGNILLAGVSCDLYPRNSRKNHYAPTYIGNHV